MSNGSYLPLLETQCNLYTSMGIVYYNGNAYLIRHKSKHTCTSTIYYQVNSVMKALNCKAKYAINIKPDPTILNAGGLILFSRFVD